MKKISTKDLVLVAMWASLIFVATAVIKIDLVTPTGPVMIKTSNALCLLAGILLGKTYGGFAAGIGSMFFDLTNPAYISSAPFTFVFFFAMAFVAGFISEKLKCKFSLVISCTIGAFTYTLLYITKTVVFTVLAGSQLVPAIQANLPKFATSCTNAVIAITLATIFYPFFKKIMDLRNRV